MIRYLLLAAAAAEAAVVEYVWEARFVFLAPDGVEKMIGTINGEYPGPEIRVKKGDTVKVQVTNDLANTGLTLHWHGILHAGWFDGVASGTQCPIGEKETFTYEFEANEAGTYWWHAHTSTLRAPSLIGPLIVEDDMPEPFEYDEELTVLLTDHWNQKDDRTLVEGLRQQQFKWVGDPQTLLLNGRGCALSNWTACQEAGVEPAYLDVEPGKTYRLRLINGGAMQFMTATVEGHNVTVVEMDGRYVEPFQVRDVDVNTGNRVSVLLEAKGQTSGSYWVHVQTKFRDTLIHGYAVLRYSNDTTLPDSDPPTEASYPEADVYSDAAYVGAASDHYVDFYNGIVAHPDAAATDPCPDTDDRFFVVTNSQERMDRFGLVSYTPYTFESGGAAYWNGSANVDPLFAETYGFYGNVEVDGSSAADGYLKWPVHVTVDADDLPSATGTAADLPATPIQLSLYYGLDPQYPAMFSLDLGAVVTVVVQNARTLNGKLEQHPWHLHGHAFWVLAHGVGLWNASYREDFNTVNPAKMDVVTVLPGSWAAIRFVADSAGAHGFHCHIAWHLSMGNAIYFATGTADQIEPPPADFPLCGAVTSAVVADFGDSTSWHKKNDPSKNCAWVALFVPTRCTVKGFDNSLAYEACRAACADYATG